MVTLRSGPNALSYIHESKPDLVVLSPGPGCPDDFKLKDTIQACIDKKVHTSIAQLSTELIALHWPSPHPRSLCGGA